MLVDGSKNIFGFGPASIGVDVPLAFGGPTNAQLSLANGAVAASANHLQFAFTPGLKARVGVPLLSPWVSFRGEVRSYVFRTPSQVMASRIDPFKGNWRSDLLFLAGVGVRF